MKLNEESPKTEFKVKYIKCEKFRTEKHLTYTPPPRPPRQHCCLPINERLNQLICVIAFNFFNDIAPTYMSVIFPPVKI